MNPYFLEKAASVKIHLAEIRSVYKQWPMAYANDRKCAVCKSMEPCIVAIIQGGFHGKSQQPLTHTDVYNVTLRRQVSATLCCPVGR